MAGGNSQEQANRNLEHALNGVAPTYPASFYLRLLTSPTSRTALGVETDYDGYERLELPRDGTVFDVSATGVASNLIELAFAQAGSTGSGDIVGFDIVDTASGAVGHWYYWGPVTPSRSVVVGKTVRFPVGSLEIAQ